MTTTARRKVPRLICASCISSALLISAGATTAIAATQSPTPVQQIPRDDSGGTDQGSPSGSGDGNTQKNHIYFPPGSDLNNQPPSGSGDGNTQKNHIYFPPGSDLNNQPPSGSGDGNIVKNTPNISSGGPVQQPAQ
ncbi:hypothetical protein [Streptomyces sp. NPDC055134]